MKEIEPSSALSKGLISNIFFEGSPYSSPSRNFAISESLKDFLDKFIYFFCSLFIKSTTSGVRFIFSSVLSKANKA